MFFGQRWDAPIVDDADQVPPPVGYACDHLIEPEDQGLIRPYFDANEKVTLKPVHRGCEMGMIVGHHFGLCSCTGWDDLYERGRELVRRADAGQLTTSRSGQTS